VRCRWSPHAQAAVLAGATRVLGLEVEPASGWLSLVPVLWAGSLCLVGVGVLVGIVARCTESAAAIANIVVLPMALLSRLVIDVSGTPSRTSMLSQALPTGWTVRGVADVLARAADPATSLLPGIGLLAIAGLGALGARQGSR
jgi:ABC-2 type transport system permease protein